MKQKKTSPPEDSEAEVAALIATLHATEQRLEALTGGEVDTVSSGSGAPFLLRRAQVELRESQAVQQAAILNALPAHIALLDATGVIVSVNEAWRRFATANHLQGPAFGIGVNYLEICDRTQGKGSLDARSAADGIRSVLDGAKSFSLEYPCHSPTEQRWFVMTGAPLSHAAAHGVVVMHVNITDRKLAEDELRESQTTMAAAQQIGHFGSWAADLNQESNEDMNSLRWSDEMFRIAGYEPGAAEVTNQFFFSRVPPEEHGLIRQAMATAIRERKRYSLVHRLIRADGATCIVQETAKIFYDEKTGRPVKIIGTAHDITERTQADLALRSGEREQRKLAERLEIETTRFVEAQAVSNVGSWETDLSTLAVIWSDETHRIFETDPGKFIPTHPGFLELVHPDDRAKVVRAFNQSLTHTGRCSLEHRLLLPGGRTKFVEERWQAHADPQGNAIKVFGTCHDVTDRRAAETALRESNERFHQLADNISDAFWIRSPDLNEVQYVSPAFEKIWGRTVASLHANPHEWREFIFTEDRARVLAAFAALTTSTPSLDIEYRIVRPDGELRWVRVRGTQVRDTSDQMMRHIGIVTDITERKHAAEDLRQTQELLTVASRLTRMGAWFVKLPELTLTLSDGARQIHGMPPGHQPTVDEAINFYIPEDRPAISRVFGDCVRDGTPFDVEMQITATTGQRIWVRAIGKADRDATGVIVSVRGAIQDISEHKKAEIALRASEHRFKALFEQAAVGVALTEAATGRFIQINQRCADIMGRSQPELLQLTFQAITHPQDLGRNQELMQQLLAGSIREFTAEKRYVRKDDAEVWVTLTVSAMWAPGESPDFCIAIMQDITDRKKLEEQFRQAQKMEAIGTLAGGIAHDFNNILAAISGYTELSRLILKDNPEVRDHLGSVMQAASRATDLVKQILSFSRQQRLERRPIQLRPVVTECLELLRASIPSTIAFDIALAADAPTVLADATQVHQVLMNLGTNAWHAMKDGPGRLQVKLDGVTVDAALAATQPRLRPGAYARLSVGDTGCGMDQATLRRIFEPFYTTKAPGEGTGLGLAVVHGIMASHDGAVTVYSQPGEGTVFHLYFPAHSGKAALANPDEAPVPRGHGERVLFVDDEESLAELGQQLLTALGYEAEVTTRPETALALVRAEPQRFALVLTDLSMPGMTGLALAGEILKIRPDLPTILTTGYSASLTPDRIRTAGIRQLLLKPMTLRSLGTAVHAALSAQPAT
jgi:PAS domain S-box-containing protein